MRKKSAFTLLELIIVVIVIGILASLALPRYLIVVEKSRAAEAKSILKDIRMAQARYSVQYGTFDNSANFANLDIRFTALKYFTFTAANAGTDVNSSSTIVASVTRNNVDKFAFTPAYVVNMTQDGNMSSSDPAYI